MKILIIGGGEIGSTLADILSREGHNITVIERSPSIMDALASRIDARFILGSGSIPSALLEAGVKGADIVIAVTSSDEINILSCLLAHSINEGAFKISRVRDSAYFDALSLLSEVEKKNPIDIILNPEKEVGEIIAKLMEVPGSTDIAEFGGGRIRLIGIKVEEDSPVTGKRLLELDHISQKLQVLIVAIDREGQIIIPKGNDSILAGDRLFLILKTENVGHIMKILGKEEKPVRRAIIYGGGITAETIAKKIEESGNNVSLKVITPSLKECERLSGGLKKTLVIHGEGTDETLLKEERVSEADFFISVHEDDEDNILSALLARRLGAHHTLLSINKISYHDIIPSLGVDTVISPKVVAIGSILQRIRKGKVISLISFRMDAAEAIEAVALPTSRITLKPLREVGFPEDAIIGAVLRGEEIIIPKGDTKINEWDRIIIFSLRKEIEKIEKQLTVKIEYF